MIEIEAAVPTLNAAKYVKQLCNHWAHKLEVEQSEGIGLVRFPAAEARMRAGKDALVVTLGAEDETTLERMKSVLADHLDRFAFREAPLTYDWARFGDQAGRLKCGLDQVRAWVRDSRHPGEGRDP